MNIDSIIYSHSYVQMKVIKFDGENWRELMMSVNVGFGSFLSLSSLPETRRFFPTTGLKMIWTLKSFVVALGCDKVLYSVHTKFNLCFQERQIIDVESAARLILDSIARFLTYSHCSYFFLFVPMCSYCLSPFLAICFYWTWKSSSLISLSPYHSLFPRFCWRKNAKWSCLGSFTKGNPAVPKKNFRWVGGLRFLLLLMVQKSGEHHLGCIKPLWTMG